MIWIVWQRVKRITKEFLTTTKTKSMSISEIRTQFCDILTRLKRCQTSQERLSHIQARPRLLVNPWMAIKFGEKFTSKPITIQCSSVKKLVPSLQSSLTHDSTWSIKFPASLHEPKKKTKKTGKKTRQASTKQSKQRTQLHSIYNWKKNSVVVTSSHLSFCCCHRRVLQINILEKTWRRK